jgi:signal transduction histidine kinase
MLTPSVQVLLVDDDDIDRELVRRLLSPRYTVREAYSGAIAQEIIAEQVPDCVLLDYRLPDVYGIHLLPIFTERYIPVIILTGEESPEIIVQAMLDGAQDYLVKSHLTSLSLERAIVNAIEKVAMRRDIEEKNRQLRDLTSELTLAEQRERRRISQVLHDHIQQTLYGIQMRVHLMQGDISDPAELREHLKVIEGLTTDAIHATRTLTVELSPPVLHEEGFASAFRWLANQMAETHGLRVTIRSEGEHPPLSEDLRVLLFQLVRELLFNVIKHAGVNEAEVILDVQNDHLVITVSDKGRGFDLAELNRRRAAGGGFGLFSIRERLALFGGRLELQSKPGSGVQAKIIAPTHIAALEFPVVESARL